LLIFPLKELPVLPRGKGNKILNIPGKRLQIREEFLVDVAVLLPTQILVVSAANKQLKLKPADWQHFVGERGQRGLKLPRVYQKPEKLAVGNE
jgi:topoisomerase-4 subunit A